MPRYFFSTFSSEIADKNHHACKTPATCISSDGRYEVYYVPFEGVQMSAPLVLVGITPGPTQLELAYDAAAPLIRAGASAQVVSLAAKQAAAFGGSMRTNLIKMLEHFRFDRILGIDDLRQLWGNASHLLHSTSVIPHAAFKNGKMFNGPFQEILASNLLRTSFMDDFVPTISECSKEALFVALGPTPRAPLQWCVKQGILEQQRVLGQLAHASGSSGSQVDYYLRKVKLEDLHPRNPVRFRSATLDETYKEMKAATDRLVSGCHEQDSIGTVLVASKEIGADIGKPLIPKANSTQSGMHAIVKRGKGVGTRLSPHRHADGTFVVSLTRFEKDYVRLGFDAEIELWLAKGYSLRMSNPASETSRSPSLVRPDSIIGRPRAKGQ